MRSLAMPEVRQRLKTLGAEPFTMEPDKFDIYVKSEIAKNITLVKALGGAPK